MSYSIISGWYADHQARDYPTKGDDFVRSASCFPIWYNCISRFTAPTNILIIDSASPVQPPLPADPRISYIALQKNFGHAAQGRSFLSGWSRALLCGLMYGYANGDLYTVLVEQGTLFYGNDIIERQIARYPTADVIAPSGAGTPQPLQTGILIFRTSIIPQFVRNYTQITVPDQVISPEKKVAIAAEGLRLQLSDLPFGRVRPIDFSASHFFLRHCNMAELRSFTEKLGFGRELVQTPQGALAG